MPRIAIIGAGAIGSSLGALLTRAGQDVTLIGRSAHVAAVRSEGLRFQGALGTFSVPIPAAEALTFRPDFAFLTVKTHNLLTAVRENLTWLDDLPVVTFQNGIRSDELVGTLIPRRRIISTVVNIHATYLSPGFVTLVDPGSLIIGRPFGANNGEIETMASILRAAVPTTVSKNIQGAHWFKLVVNLNNAFPAINNTTFHEVFADRQMRELAVGAMREGLRVTKQSDIKLEPIPGASVALMNLMEFAPLQVAAMLFATRLRRIESEWPLLGSTLQSLRRSQPTEIDYLNGEVVRLGEQFGVPTPINSALVNMVHRVEQTGKFWNLDEIRSALNPRIFA